jgi:branched-chain amino acid transport system permease protein
MRLLATAGKIVAFAAGVVALAALPSFISDFRASDFAYVGVFFIAILGLNVLTGFTGQISLGHGAFMALGGYTTAILVVDHGVRDLWTIPLAGLVAGAAGFLFGLPALRLRGPYLALATFAVAVAAPAVLEDAEGLTGGTRGLQLFGEPSYTGEGFAPSKLLGFTLSFNDALYYVTWTCAAVLLAVAWLLLGGRAGRAFRALRESEVGATAFGVNPAAYKTLAFAISAFYAGVAGSLFVLLNTFVNPQTFPVTLSIQLVIGVVVAGLGSLWASFAGAALVHFLPDVAQDISKSPGAPDLIYGVVLIAIMLALPTGVAGLGRRVVGLRRRLGGAA